MEDKRTITKRHEPALTLRRAIFYLHETTLLNLGQYPLDNLLTSIANYGINVGAQTLYLARTLNNVSTNFSRSASTAFAGGSRMNMPNMLAFTIRGGGQGSNVTPQVFVGSNSNTVQLTPQNPSDDTYWIAILDANKPTTLVKDFLIPGSSNSTVPAGLDAYMSNPNYIYAVTTQCLSTIHVPQGDWYDYLVKYGASRELQRIEQVNSSIGCGSLGQVGYVLIGQGGPRGGSNIPPPTYEMSTIFEYAIILMMSLMPMPNGSPPYSLCDSYTFVTR